MANVNHTCLKCGRRIVRRKGYWIHQIGLYLEPPADCPFDNGVHRPKLRKN